LPHIKHTFDLCLAGGSSKIVHRPAVEPYPHQRQPDITKAKKILRWQPAVNTFLSVLSNEKLFIFFI